MATSRLFNIPQIAPFQSNMYLTWNLALNTIERGLNGGTVFPFHPEEAIDWNDWGLGDPVSNNENVFLAINGIDYLNWAGNPDGAFWKPEWPPMGIRLPHAKHWMIYNRLLYIRNDDPHWPIVVMSRYDEGYYADTLNWLQPGQVGVFFSDGLNLHVLHKRFGDGSLNEGYDNYHYFRWWIPNLRVGGGTMQQTLPYNVTITPTDNPLRAYTRGMLTTGDHIFYLSAGFFSTIAQITFNGLTPHAGVVSFFSSTPTNATAGKITLYTNTSYSVDQTDVCITVELETTRRVQSYFA